MLNPDHSKTAAAKISMSPAKVAVARMFMRSVTKRASLATSLADHVMMNPRTTGAALGAVTGAAGGALAAGEGNRMQGALGGAALGGAGGAALGHFGGLDAGARGGQALYERFSPLAASARNAPDSVPWHLLAGGLENAGAGGMAAAGLGAGAVLGSGAGALAGHFAPPQDMGTPKTAAVSDALKRILGGAALGTVGGAGFGALSSHVRDDDVGRGATRGAMGGGALGALGGLAYHTSRSVPSFGRDVFNQAVNPNAAGSGSSTLMSESMKGLGLGVGGGIAYHAGSAAFGSPETREMRDKELGKFQAMQEIREYQSSHLEPLHHAAFARAQHDEIIGRADSAMMQSSFNTMKKFAPNLAADHNAVTSFLRESAAFGTGPSYATLKNLADAEKSVVNAGGTPGISF